jgi:RNA polymerase sigma-70 factor (ECF subfamily)
MQERAAVVRLQQGDINGLEPLVRQYQLQAVRAAYLITRDHALAEDIVQTAFIRAFERIGQFDPRQRFGPWFLRSVVNDALKAAARRERQVSLEASPDAALASLAELLLDAGPALDALSEQAETSRTIWAALAELPPAQRAAIVQSYYLGMSEAEMAADLQVAPGTIKWRLHSGREKLRAAAAVVRRAVHGVAVSRRRRDSAERLSPGAIL